MQDKVILVDNADMETGTMDKMEAHQKAVLHRAVSVFIFNTNGEWLIQQRAKEKYHSNQLWSNACCTHPMPGEGDIEAAKRRLMEEMGIRCELKEIFSFIYKEDLDNELTEHELDHVFIGVSDTPPQPNPAEVMNYQYISKENLMNELKEAPEKYTVWFRKIVSQVQQHL